jgi:hypothetical protein
VSAFTDDALGLGWVPAPAAGSAARRVWPRTARLVWWLVRRPLIPLAMAGLVVLGVVHGRVPAVVVVVGMVAVLSVWEHAHRSSFDATAWRVLWERGARPGPTACGGGPR